MVGIPESELSRAQADVEPRLSPRVNCGSVKKNRRKRNVIWYNPPLRTKHILLFLF